MKKLMSLSLLVLFFAACAHHRDVRPGDDGVHSVVVSSEDTEEGSRDAIQQANHFCEQRGQYATFIKEEQKYTGDMDEQNYKNAKKATKVAQVVGGAAWTLGGKKESDLGGIVGVGATAADAAIGKGYTVAMKFKCK